MEMAGIKRAGVPEIGILYLICRNGYLLKLLDRQYETYPHF